MKRLVILSFILIAAFASNSTAQAEPGGGAAHVDCTYIFPDSEGGKTVITPRLGVNHSCRYAGPAEGGGADTDAYGLCVLTPAGNLNCNVG